MKLKDEYSSSQSILSCERDLVYVYNLLRSQKPCHSLYSVHGFSVCRRSARFSLEGAT